MEKNVYLGLGSNIGERLVYLRLACRYLESLKAARVLKYSSVYRSPPVEYSNQPEFYNCVIKIQTRFSPVELLKCVKWIERSIGRSLDTRRWGPRIIDIDIVLYGKSTLANHELTVPHKELYKRSFWLKPLSEIYGKRREYFSGETWQELLKTSGEKMKYCKKVYPGGYLK